MALSSGVTISHKQVQKSAEDDERERERSRAGVLDPGERWTMPILRHIAAKTPKCVKPSFVADGQSFFHGKSAAQDFWFRVRLPSPVWIQAWGHVVVCFQARPLRSGNRQAQHGPTLG